MTMKGMRIIVVACIICFTASLSAHAISITNISNGDVTYGLWGQTWFWDPAQIPTASDDVFIQSTTNYAECWMTAPFYNPKCSNMTWMSNLPGYFKIAANSSLRVYGYSSNAFDWATTPELQIYDSGALTVDGHFYAPSNRFTMYGPAGFFTNNSASEMNTWIMHIVPGSGIEVSVPAGIWLESLELRNGTANIITNNLRFKVNGSIRYNTAQPVSEDIVIGSPILNTDSNSVWIWVRTNCSVTIPGTITNGGTLVSGTGIEATGARYFTGDSYFGWYYGQSGESYFNGTVYNTYPGDIVGDIYYGEIGGTGLVYKNITIQSNALLNPGAADQTIGTLRVPDNNLTFNSNGTYNCEMDGTAETSDSFICSNLNLVAGSKIAIDVMSGVLSSSSYLLATYSNMIGVGTFAVTSGLPVGYSLDYNYGGSNQIALYQDIAPDEIVIVSAVPSGVGPESAYANGTLIATGLTECTVFLYWGDNDGSNNPSAWDNVVSLGPASSLPVDYTNLLANLDFTKTYYYTHYATNATTNIWAGTVRSFQAGTFFGSINYGDYGRIVEDSDVDTFGEFDYAINFYSYDDPDGDPGQIQVGDVTFDSVMRHNGPSVEDFAVPGVWSDIIKSEGSANWGPDGSGMSPNLRELLYWYGMDWTDDLLINLSNVVVSQDYKLQMLFHDRTLDSSVRGFDITVEGVLVADDLVPERDCTNNWGDAAWETNAMIYTYRFTAADTVVNIAMAAGPNVRYVNALTLERYDFDVPEIKSDGASGGTPTSCYMNGSLLSTGSSETTVFLYYGESDQGTNASSWDVELPFGVVTEDPRVVYSTNITGLAGGKEYFYRFLATNSFGEYWSSKSRYNYMQTVVSNGNDYVSVHEGTYAVLGSDSDLDLSGRFLYAINAGDENSAVSPLTIGDATFVSLFGPGQSAAVDPTNFPAGYDSNINISDNRAWWNNPAEGVGLSSEIRKLLARSHGHWGYTTTLAITNPSAPHKLQLMFYDGETYMSSQIFDVEVDGKLVLEGASPMLNITNLGSVMLDVGAGYSNGVNGMYFSYTFMPTGSIVSLNMGSHPGYGWGAGRYSAMTLEELSGPSESQAPVINNDTATNVTASDAWLNGLLYSKGGSPTTVKVFWGDEDGSVSSWDNSYSLGVATGTVPKSFTHYVSGLSDKVSYFYTYYASNASGEAWASPSMWFNNSGFKNLGVITVLDDTNFSDIDLDGDIVYAINCGQAWYTGSPTGTNPPFDGDWGTALVDERTVTVSGVTFKGDVWNWDDNARLTNYYANYTTEPPIESVSNRWFYRPQRFSPPNKQEGFSCETKGWAIGKYPDQPRTNCVVYDWRDLRPQRTAIFNAGTEEDKMETVIGKVVNVAHADYNPTWGVGQRDMIWHFDVKSGYRYKVQMFFFDPDQDFKDCRVEVDGVLAVDGLNLTNEVVDRTSEALMWSYTFNAQTDVLDVLLGDSTLTDPPGNYWTLISAITVEEVTPSYSIISIW